MSWLDALSGAKPVPPSAPGGNKPSPAPGPAEPGTRPGDDFSIRADWADILLPLGAVLHHEASGGVRYWTRPGKDRRNGYSATTGWADDADRLKMFTSSWPPFADGEVYTKFAAYALLNHGGDYQAAARELGRAGYGSKQPAPASSPAAPAGDDEVPWPAQPRRTEPPEMGPHPAGRPQRPWAQEGGAVSEHDIRVGDLAVESGFWKAHAGLTQIRDWARARRAGPYALLGEILLQAMARVPPQVMLPPLGSQKSGDMQGAASLNQIIASVGPSGLSKGLAHGLAAGIVEWPKSLNAPLYAPLGTGEGISSTFVVCRKQKGGQLEMIRVAWSALLSATEVDKFAALTSRKTTTLGATLRMAWSGEPLGEANATEERRRYVPRNGYRLGIVIHVQPGRGAALLNEDEVAGGTPQRVLWLPAPDPDIPDTAPAAPPRIAWQPPQEILTANAELEARGMDEITALDPVILPVCARALAEIDRATVARHRGEAGALDGHALLVREKLAAALGIYLGHFGVTDDDWELAGQLMSVSDMTRESVSQVLRRAMEQENEARGRAEARRAQILRRSEESDALLRASQRVMKVLRERKEWVSRSDLRREAGSRYRDYLDDATEHLLKDGKIEYRDTSRADGGHGGTGIQYRISDDRDQAKNRGGRSTPVHAVA